VRASASPSSSAYGRCSAPRRLRPPSRPVTLPGCSTSPRTGSSCRRSGPSPRTSSRPG
jgi:hypothetical protein